MTPIIETKVALPAVVNLILTTLGSALYLLAKSYGWISPTPEQEVALIRVGAGILLCVNVVVAYLSPHTERPDLDPPIEVGAARVR